MGAKRSRALGGIEHPRRTPPSRQLTAAFSNVILGLKCHQGATILLVFVPQAVKDTRSALVSATEDRLALSALLGAAPLVILVSDQKVRGNPELHPAVLELSKRILRSGYSVSVRAPA